MLRFKFLALAAITFTSIVLSAPALAAPEETVLYNFCSSLPYCPDGQQPNGGLVFDQSGNLYGATAAGGTECIGGGTVFELTPTGGGTWAHKVLHSFPCDTEDGFGPNGSLVFDASGNLYGTTVVGGGGSCNEGCGIVFELTPGNNGQWTEQILHSFGSGNDGYYPEAGLTFDAAGNLYGTTRYGGAYDNCGPYGPCGGTVFQLTSRGNGKWTEKVLHSFHGLDKDERGGFWPEAGVAIDALGNLYGTASMGGSDFSCNNYASYCGLVYQLTPGQNGQWRYKVIHVFDGSDGYWPQSTLILDSLGNLYGTTPLGGRSDCTTPSFGPGSGCGTVFELILQADGRWTEKVLRAFYRNRGTPYSGANQLIFDSSGNLYGITLLGGHYDNSGTAFELSPATRGPWTETTLHSFGNPADGDGAAPSGGLIFDAAGNLYGTTVYGGTGCFCGTVFEITP